MARLALLEPWRTRVLWLSLAGNLFALALFAAPFVTHRRPPPGPPGFDRMVGRMATRLPPPDDERFRTAMEKERPWYEIGREKIEQARTDLATAIGRDPFDPAQASAAFANLQARLRDASARFDESLVMALAGLSPAARAQLAADMARRRP